MTKEHKSAHSLRITILRMHFHEIGLQHVGKYAVVNYKFTPSFKGLD